VERVFPITAYADELEGVVRESEDLDEDEVRGLGRGWVNWVGGEGEVRGGTRDLHAAVFDETVENEDFGGGGVRHCAFLSDWYYASLHDSLIYPSADDLGEHIQECSWCDE